MAYLLDADVFVQAKNLHYGFEFCPAFWDWIDARAAEGAVLSIDKVRDELIGGGDELADWAEARDEQFFLKADAAVLDSLRHASTWTNLMARFLTACSSSLRTMSLSFSGVFMRSGIRGCGEVGCARLPRRRASAGP